MTSPPAPGRGWPIPSRIGEPRPHDRGAAQTPAARGLGRGFGQGRGAGAHRGARHRGTLWPGEDCGLLHRSPPIAGTGETRLLLVIELPEQD
ncbi:DUF1826 domain-containing protein [Stagnihabitans tardus]|uniref:DUF1826 domain-containing protein n=1 Tax=Stagnihabitans tardus TaxID=2699202 RepID=A0AAE5BWU7_9RHOB|nr:DUF1826 domain-containing protein [Stagnihabitans tardus]